MFLTSQKSRREGEKRPFQKERQPFCGWKLPRCKRNRLLSWLIWPTKEGRERKEKVVEHCGVELEDEKEKEKEKEEEEEKSGIPISPHIQFYPFIFH